MDESHEYEKVLGKATKCSLFSDEEEAYKALRQSIIDSPHSIYDKSKLPFTDIKIYNYDLYLLKLHCDKYKQEKKRLYYIKDDTPGEASVLAFGYFEEKENTFYLLANSLIRKTGFSDNILQIPYMYKSKMKFSKGVTKRSVNLDSSISTGYRTTTDIPCSASFAASYVLGEKADYTKWKSLLGQPLSESYAYYVNNTAELVFIHKIWNDVCNPKPQLQDFDKHLLYDKIIAPLLFFKQNGKTPPKITNIDYQSFIHCYLIDNSNDPKYHAEGFYNPKDRTINVVAGAELANDVISFMQYTIDDFERRGFIKEYCSTIRSKILLKKDYSFNMIDTATFYITGDVINGLKAWKTVSGKTLGNFLLYQIIKS